MELATIDMHPGEARERFKEYRAAVRERRDEEAVKEDAEIMRGYREIGRGNRVISLRQTIAAGGRYERGLPKIAVRFGDAEVCYVQVFNDGAVNFAKHGDFTWHSRRRVLSFPSRTLGRHTTDWSGPITSDTSVPLIPPALRPAGDLSRYLILWEAKWRRVAKDPALLRPVGKDLAVVVAVWDLTEVERAVLGMRS